MSKATKKRYLGLDLSLAYPGLAVVDVDRGHLRIVHLDSLPNGSKRWDEGQRLDHVGAWMKCALYQFGPFDGIVREQAPNGHNAHVSRALFGVRAASEICFRGLGVPILEYSPATVKKQVAGNGRATKEDVERGVLSYFPDAEPRNDNETDALAVLLTHFKKEGVI
jgi:crossover junction endodeoxyribonuclease RuvC